MSTLIKPLLLLSCLVASGFALAQAPEKVLGVTADVQGLVTVSNGIEVASVTAGKPVINATRYVTSSAGSVTLKFHNCEVRLKPNQAVTVDEHKICDGMIASIQTLPGLGTGPVLAGGGFHLGIALLTGAVLTRGGSGGSGAIGNGGGNPDTGGSNPGNGGNPGGVGGQIPIFPPPNFSNQ